MGKIAGHAFKKEQWTAAAPWPTR